MRWVEVEVHHADLALGHTAAHWPPALVSELMARRERELEQRGPAFTWRATDTGEAHSSGDGPEVSGAAADLLWWLLGRGAGERLTSSSGTLPTLGRWA
jgi:maleylpyruvate isomerase